MHLHNVRIAYSKCLPTRLNPLAERTCFSQAEAFLFLTAISLPWHLVKFSCGLRAFCTMRQRAMERLQARLVRKKLSASWNGGVLVAGTLALVSNREKQIRGSGVHLNPLGLFLCTSIPCVSSILSACLPA
jgi:hypothetical protein